MLLVLFSVLMVCLHQADAGAEYIRWGRAECPKGSQLLYRGFTATSHYTHTGSGSNHICLHHQPKFTNVLPGSQAWAGALYGVEYELPTGYGNNVPFSFANNNGQSIQDNDAPCAVCVNPAASFKVIVSGRPDCPNDMHLEYNGFLVSDHHGYQKSEFLCLDSVPDVREGGQANNDGGLFYPVQASCGALPCPPYVEGNEITCAVCTM